MSITVRAPTNIALIKYWGKSDAVNNLPLNSSISLTVDINAFFTETTVEFQSDNNIELQLNGKSAQITNRIKRVIDTIRELCDPSLKELGIKIVSQNSFPTAAGMASSASGLAALVFALSILYKLNISTQELSCIARLGSGSASRSLFGGIVEWRSGTQHLESYSSQLATNDEWPELRLLVIITSSVKKDVSSTDAMLQVTPSLLTRANCDVPLRITALKNALAGHDFQVFANIIMEESNHLHRIINEAGVNYLTNVSHRIIGLVEEFNCGEVRAAYTFDAGPNAWIVIRNYDIPAFLELLLKNLIISYENIHVHDNCEMEVFMKLQESASLNIERITEAMVSSSGPVQINLAINL